MEKQTITERGVIILTSNEVDKFMATVKEMQITVARVPRTIKIDAGTELLYRVWQQEADFPGDIGLLLCACTKQYSKLLGFQIGVIRTEPLIKEEGNIKEGEDLEGEETQQEEEGGEEGNGEEQEYDVESEGPHE